MVGFRVPIRLGAEEGASASHLPPGLLFGAVVALLPTAEGNMSAGLCRKSSVCGLTPLGWRVSGWVNVLPLVKADSYLEYSEKALLTAGTASRRRWSRH